MWRLLSPWKAPLITCNCGHHSISSLDRLCDWTNWFCSITGWLAWSWLHTMCTLYTLYTCTEHSRLPVVAENEPSVSGKEGSKHQTSSINTDKGNICTTTLTHNTQISSDGLISGHFWLFYHFSLGIGFHAESEQITVCDIDYQHKYSLYSSTSRLKPLLNKQWAWKVQSSEYKQWRVGTNCTPPSPTHILKTTESWWRAVSPGHPPVWARLHAGNRYPVLSCPRKKSLN